MIKRLENENEEQFLWRVGQLKDNGSLDLNWEEIADLMNKEFRDDVSDYRTEAAYRKPYQQAKRFYEAGTFQKYSDESYIDELRKAKQEIRKEKQKLFDERTAINKTLRENARIEEDLEKLKLLIERNGVIDYPCVNELQSKDFESDNDLIVVLSDLHLGMNANNYFGSYNTDVAKERLTKYLERIVQIQELHQSENVYIFLLGDILNGNIHFTTQLENRENVVEQVQKAAELVSQFIYEASKYFKGVFVNGVAGNHSRTSFKDQVLRNDRLDNLIPWYMKAKLSHLDNVKFIDDNNYDSTIGNCTIRDKQYLIVHGDYDSFSENGVSKLVMLLGYKPTAIFYGHLHRCSFDDIAGVKIIRSGSLCGAVDDFTISHRFSGQASQMVCVATKNGIETYYPVQLD